ncbi:MAG: hypothetical protein ACT4TC_12865 [Myxococcaceae bacterium]
MEKQRKTWWIVAGVGAALFALQVAAQLDAIEWLLRGLGFAVGAAAAVFAHRATLERRQAELLRRSSPTQIEGAPHNHPVLVRGRLVASEPVVSPGGIVCALYDAEVRRITDSGDRGELISKETAGSTRLYLEGDRARVGIDREHVEVLAKEQIHRCRATGPAEETEKVLAEGDPLVDAFSYERLGKLGQTCCAFGKLVGRNGRYELQGAQGGDPLLVIGDSPALAAKPLIRRSWTHFAVSAALCVASAWLMR